MRAVSLRLWVLAALVLVSCWGSVALAEIGAGARQERAGAGAVGVQARGDSDILPLLDSPSIGPAKAPVTIVMFTNYQCPFSARAMTTVKALVETEYKGKVRVVFKHNPLDFHKDAPLAAEAAMAAHAQGKFSAYQDLLMANQRELKREHLENYAQQLRLNMQRFKSDLDSGRFKALIARDRKLAESVGARGTPAFFVNGVLISGAQPIDKFKEAIDRELPEVARTRQGYAQRVKANFKAPTAPSRGAAPAVDTTVYKVPVGDSPVLGGPDAVVTIVIFADLQCPFCARVQATLRDIMVNSQGKVRLVFKHFPLAFHQQADLAAQAAIEAHEQGKFWAFQDLLFANQKALGRDDLIRYAGEVGMDVNRLIFALDRGKHAGRVQADVELGKKVGVRGTPHFFVNGVRLSGAQPLPAFEKAVDEAIVRADALISQRGLRGQALYDALMDGAAEAYVDPAPGPAPTPKPSGPFADDVVHEVPVGKSPVTGAARGKITIVVFNDFQCPFCGRAVGTLDALLKKYPNDIRLVFKHQPLPFHKDARLAAIASMAAHRQGKFWPYYELLFANQRELKREDLIRYAQQLGLNLKRFEADLDDPAVAALVDADQKLAEQVGARGTPTFFINGRKFVGAQPLERFEEAIDAVRKGGPK